MEDLAQYEAAIAIIAGVFLCLFGYRIKKIAFVLIWFAIGYYLMSQVAPNLTSDPVWQQILPIATGLILGILGFSIEKVCIFAVTTFSVATTIIDAFQFNEVLPIAAAIAIGAVCGFIAIAIIKPAGIISTSLSGGKFIAKYVVASTSIPHEPWFLIILAVCTGVGILFQFKTCRHID